MKTTNRTGRKSALESLVSRKLLSIEGKNALIKCTDPFHDLEVDLVGIPDALPEKSIVREVKKTIQIMSPLADKTLPFDCHIFTLPERNYIDTAPAVVKTRTGVMYQDGTIVDSATTSKDFRYGPVVIVTVASKEATTPASPLWPPVGQIGIQVIDFNDFLEGQSREIFSAFEVHNVTNKLNVGGTVTTYRLPQFTYATTLSVQAPAAANNLNLMPGKISRLPPGDVEDCMLLPGTRQWEAEHGCYCVETFRMDQNLPQCGENGIRVLASGDFPGGYGAANTLPVIARFFAPASAGIIQRSPQFKAVEKDTSGAYFTGLPGQTQLTVTVRKGIETFPSFKDPLVTLARATPDYDPIFFELYKRIAQELPVGVAVGENASGDFWDKILGIIQQVAPALGPLGGPIGGLVAGGVSQAAKLVQQKRNEKANDADFKGGKSVVKAPKNVIQNIPKKR